MLNGFLLPRFICHFILYILNHLKLLQLHLLPEILVCVSTTAVSIQPISHLTAPPILLNEIAVNLALPWKHESCTTHKTCLSQVSHIIYKCFFCEELLYWQLSTICLSRLSCVSDTKVKNFIRTKPDVWEYTKYKIQHTLFYSNFTVNMKRHTYFGRTNSYFFKLKIEFKLLLFNWPGSFNTLFV